MLFILTTIGKHTCTSHLFQSQPCKSFQILFCAPYFPYRLVFNGSNLVDVYLFSLANLKLTVVRTCSELLMIFIFFFSWLLYEKPGFQGRIIALEEGPTEQIVNMWAEEGTPTTLDQMGQPVPTAPMVIGSVRLAVRVSADALSFCFHISVYNTCCYGYFMFCNFVFPLKYNKVPVQVYKS